MTQIDFTKLAVRISVKGSPVGTGVLLNPSTDSQWVYLVTAKHCLKDCESLDLLSIDFFQGASQGFKSIQLSENFERVDTINQDLTFITIPSLALKWDIPIVPIYFKINHNENCFFYGFPKSFESKKLEPVSSNIFPICETLKLINPSSSSQDPSTATEENVKGYSGSGIFLQKHDNYVLVGIVTDYLASNNSFDGVSFSSLPKLLGNKKLLVYDEFSEANIEKLPLRIQYNKPDSFIARLIYPKKYSEKDEREPEFLYKIFDFNNPKTILLRGDGGIGKSLELQNLAAHFSKTENIEFYPVLIRLREYVSKSIDDLLNEYFPEWKNIPISRLLVILDGYDEVNSKEREIFLRYLSRFQSLNTNCTILISTRNNFAESFKNTEIEGFSHYILNAFEEQDVKNYISSVLGNEKLDKFLTAIEGYTITSLFIKIPFYLAYFVELYQNDHKKVPQNLKELLDMFISYRIQRDSNRHFESDQKHIYELTAKKLSFLLNLWGMSQISSIDILSFFSIDEKECLHRLSIVEIGENIAFKHLSFQEYLAAKVLSAQTKFEKVKQCITFGPDYNKLKPKWQNTLRLLIEVTEGTGLKNDLLNFVSSQEPELLLKIEYQQISLENRFELFKKVVTQSDRIYKNSAPYYSRELALFAGITENPEVIYYLMDRVKDKNTPIKTRGEYLFYLQSATNFSLYDTNELKDLITIVILTDDWHFQKSGINVLNSLKINDERLTNTLIYKIPNLETYRIRDEIYEYLNNLPSQDEFINFYIEGINIYYNWARTSEYYGGLGYHLIKGLSKMTSPYSVSEILEYISKNPTQLDDYRSVLRNTYHKSFIIHLAENSVIAFGSDDRIYEKALTLFCSLPFASRRGLIQDFASFFWETNTQDIAFWSLLNEFNTNKRRTYLDQIGSLASKTTLDECCIKYKESSLQVQDMWDILHSLYWTKSSLAQEFREKLIVIDNDIFSYRFEPIWDEIDKKRELFDLGLLLNKSKFKSEIKKVFDYYITEELNNNQVLTYRKDWTEVESNLSVMLLNDFTQSSDSITWDNFIKWINNDTRWEWYVIGELYKYSNKKEIKLSLQHINFIIQWCKRQINKIDFKTAVKDKENNSWTSRYLETYVAKFWILYNFSLPGTIILDMLKFDTQSMSMYKEEDELTLSEIIIERLNNNELVINQILENLKDGLLPKLVLSSHIRLCKKLMIKDAKLYIFKVLKSNQFEEYELNQFLEVYLELGGKLDEMSYIFDSFDCQNNFHWDLLYKFAEEPQFKFRIKRLLEHRKSLYYTPERISNGITLLIKTGSIEGLKSLISWTKEHFTIPIDGRQKYQDLSNLPKDEAISLLFMLLELVIQQNIQSVGDFVSALDITLNMLHEVLVNDEKCFEKGKKGLNELILNTQSDENLQYRLKRFYFDVEKEYYNRKDDKENLDDILELVIEYVK